MIVSDVFPCAFTPTLDPAVTAARLDTLLSPRVRHDATLVRRADRLDALFHNCAAACPVPLWSPGLIIQPPWRAVIDTFLPLADILPSFRRLLECSLRYPPASDPLNGSVSWPDLLGQWTAFSVTTNPAPLMKRLLNDETLRRQWLFTLLLPPGHGNAFGRYPAQLEFLRCRLRDAAKHSVTTIACLDAACGTGEGTWELALLLRDLGFSPDRVTLDGTSLEPLELFAAAHASFPHDHRREERYRNTIRPLVATGWADSITFSRDDLIRPGTAVRTYDLILCNGLLGGPLLHDPGRIDAVLAHLTGQLADGGMLMATDRFHDGWRKQIPRDRLRALLAGHGLRILEMADGIAGEKR